MLLRNFYLSVFAILLSGSQIYAQQANKWHITNDGGIAWAISPNEVHTDRVEMSGKKMSCILTYGIDKNERTVVSKRMVFPMLRTIPNNTHGSLILTDTFNIANSLLVNGKPAGIKPKTFYQKGYLAIVGQGNGGLSIERLFYPSVDKAAYIELAKVKNNGKTVLALSLPVVIADKQTPPEKGVDGTYNLHTEINLPAQLLLKPGEESSFSVISTARKMTEPQLYLSVDYELAKRKTFISSLSSQLQLQTPDAVVNKMFEFAKFRTTESIFDTKNGLMHGPGGGSYYAAIWANDQAEYVDPFFPFVGNAEGNESAINSFRLFASYMNPEYKPIPSSIIAEGIDTWHGAGDRGDQAMIAYGAARFALAYGDIATAKKLWPLIEWCLNFLEKKKTADGVIASDSDELEGRFPAGKVNLATNSLTYGALISAANLATSLGKVDEQKQYLKRAEALKKAIDKYFGADVQGYDTYRYYDGNTKLRAWICLPLVMGIDTRARETAKALLSDKLWTENGILTESGSKTFWDRATLYAFRGLYNAGFTDTATKYLGIYSEKRLLKDHVPYAIEAWPEGDKRHLSAESGLYCRTITEGLFGIEPLSFNSFSIKPVLPKKWNNMALNHIRAFNADVSISVVRAAAGKAIVKVFNNGKLIKTVNWDQKQSVVVKL